MEVIMTTKKFIMFTALTSISFWQLHADDRIEKKLEPQPPTNRENTVDDETRKEVRTIADEEEDDVSIQFAVEKSVGEDEKGNAINFAFDKTERQDEEEDVTGSAFDRNENEDEKGYAIRFAFDKTERATDGDEEEGKNSFSC